MGSPTPQFVPGQRRGRGGSKGSAKGSAKGKSNGEGRRSWARAKNRRVEPRQCPVDWIEAIKVHYPEISSLIVEWQKGSGDYRAMEDLGAYKDEWAFADIEGKPRKKLNEEERQKIAAEMGQDIWDYLCSVTDADGPRVNYKLYGIGMNKDGAEFELFAISRQCDLRSEQGWAVDRDNADGDSDVNAALRWSTTSNRDLMGGNVKMMSAVADPMKEVSGMIRETVVSHRAAMEAKDDVIRDRAQLELEKIKKEMWVKRIDAGKEIVTHALDVLAGDLGRELLTFHYMKYGGDPAPASIMEAARELSLSMPVAASLWLDGVDGDHGNLGLDFVSACARAAESSEEREAAETFRAIAKRLQPHSEGLRERLHRRTRIVLHVLRGRLLFFQVVI